MTPRDFAYWLQGYVEVNSSKHAPTDEQWQVIKDHLKLVFEKETPDRGGEGVKKSAPVQEEFPFPSPQPPVWPEFPPTRPFVSPDDWRAPPWYVGDPPPGHGIELIC